MVNPPRVAAANRAESTDIGHTVSFATDRAALQRLSRARELIAEEKFADATHALGAILENPQDYFFQPDRSASVHRSIKSEAQRLLAELPVEGRDAYELRYGARARQLLEEAVDTGNADQLAEISLRYFHTEAGYEATHLLGSLHLSQGRPLTAALYLKRLHSVEHVAARLEPALSVQLATCWARAGMREEAEATLRRLHEALPGAKVHIAGAEQTLFADPSRALDWLASQVGVGTSSPLSAADQWVMFRGNAARNAETAGGSPLLSPRWRVRVTNDPVIETLVEQLRQFYAERGLAPLPILHPLVVGDVVLMRSTHNLLAVDFRTGKRLWEVPPDESLERLLLLGGTASQPRGSSFVVEEIERRLWDDATYGTLSSDGRHVFSIEDLGPRGEITEAPVVGAPVPPERLAAKPYNRLAAHEIRTGKLAWEIGGPASEPALAQAGAFFLGPPLPLVGRLYVLADINNEIRLLVVDPQTGRADWSQQLAIVEHDVMRDPVRRLAGASPSYADGVLVCPTSSGAVVAIDLTTRSLLWGYQYSGTLGAEREQMMALRAARGNVPGGRFYRANRWGDSSVTIAQGQVLLTPVESDELHCLRLSDGTLSWTKPRGDGLFMGGIRDGRAIVVTRRAVRLLNLDDGATAAEIGFPDAGTPTGRGFLSGERYYVPLSTSEVVAVDLRERALADRVRSRKQIAPGNLVCYQGAVVSQAADFVECYHQLDALERHVSQSLEERPDDARALSLRGEIRLDGGEPQSAIADLRRSFAADPEPRTRELLVESLLEALEEEFANHRGSLKEIERLLDGRLEQHRYWKIVAAGLKATAEHLHAFETYLKIVDSQPTDAALEPISGVHAVRPDRWIQAELGLLRHAAPQATQGEMDRALARRLDDVMATSDPQLLRRFIHFFGNQPAGDAARDKLWERYRDHGSLLEQERTFEARERESTNRGELIARRARLAAEAGRLDDAALLYRSLARDFADLVCLDGKTGRQLIAELAPDSPIRTLLLAPEHWPTGHVEKGRFTAPRALFRFASFQFDGRRSPFFDGVTVELQQNRSVLAARDGTGREKWTVSLLSEGSLASYAYTQEVNRCTADGHLLLVTLGHRLFAVDTLGTSGAPAEVLWSEDLTDTLPGAAINPSIQAIPEPLPWGGRRFVATDGFNRPLGTTGPITADAVFFTRQRTLFCVDALSGEKLWTRGNIPSGSELFGDEELLFVVPPDSTDALVLRTLDGQQVGSRPLPGRRQRVVALGRRWLCWESEQGQDVLRLYDPWESSTLWRREFTSGAKADLIGIEKIGVVERSGRFVLLNTEDGAPLVDASLTAEPSLSEIFLLAAPDRYLLVVNRAWQNNNNVFVKPVPGFFNNPMVHGTVYGIDRQTGEQLWSAEVERQGLVLDQPADLPVLAFASNTYERLTNNRPPRTSQYWSVLCLDKRDGRVLHQERSTGQINNFDLAAEPEKNMVSLYLPKDTITMIFTGKPLEAADRQAEISISE